MPVEAAIVAKHEFIEITVDVLAAQAVICAKEGVKLVKASPELLTAFKTATKEVMDEESAEDPMFKKIYDSQVAFIKQNQKWTEYGYLPRDFK